MPVLSITRLKLKSRNPVGLGFFLWHTMQSARQAEVTPGFLGGKLLRDADLTFWTVTLWRDHDTTRAFRDKGAHLRVLRSMKMFDRYCSEAAVLTIKHPTGIVPDVQELHLRLQQEGRYYTLSQPTQDHQNHTLRPPRILGSSLLRPKSGLRTHRAIKEEVV